MWPNPQETTDLVTFTKEMENEKPHFCTVTVLCDISTLRILSQTQCDNSYLKAIKFHEN